MDPNDFDTRQRNAEFTPCPADWPVDEEGNDRDEL